MIFQKDGIEITKINPIQKNVSLTSVISKLYTNNLVKDLKDGINPISYYQKRPLVIESLESKGKYYLLDGHHTFYTYFLGINDIKSKIPVFILKYNKTPKKFKTDELLCINTLKILQLSVVLANMNLEIHKINSKDINLLNNDNILEDAKKIITSEPEYLESQEYENYILDNLEKRKEYLKIKTMNIDRNVMPQLESNYILSIDTILEDGLLNWSKYI